MTEPVRKECPLDGAAVSYLEWPNARPALHFAHATGFNAETYRALLSPLARKLHVFASDQRGHGRTTLPTAEGMARDWTVYRDDLARLLKHIHPEPLVLAGHSMGAIASLMVAAAEPRHVCSLVLVEPVLMPAPARLLMKVARLVGRPGKPDLAQRASRRRDIFPSREAAFDSYRDRGAFTTWPREFLEDYLAGGMVPTGNGTEVRLACAPMWEAHTFTSTPPGIARLAKKVRCPITVIYAESGTARQNEIAIIARAHPGARLIKVPGATHFLPMERPDIVRDELERAATH